MTKPWMHLVVIACAVLAIASRTLATEKWGLQELELKAARNYANPLKVPSRHLGDHNSGDDSDGVLVYRSVQSTIASATVGLSAQEITEGFVSLFDGRTLSGWQGATETYAVDRGALVCRKHGKDDHLSDQHLFTTKQYSDFVFRFEFKLEPGGNNGVAVRSPLKGRPSRDGMEIQILDDYADRYKNLAPHQYNGSIYLLAPAKRGHLKPAGEWNSEEIIFKGRHAKVTLNGVVIVDVDLDNLQYKKYLHLSAGRTRKQGHIGFLGHGSRVEFRNIRIKEL